MPTIRMQIEQEYQRYLAKIERKRTKRTKKCGSFKIIYR